MPERKGLTTRAPRLRPCREDRALFPPLGLPLLPLLCAEDSRLPRRLFLAIKPHLSGWTIAGSEGRIAKGLGAVVHVPEWLRESFESWPDMRRHYASVLPAMKSGQAFHRLRKSLGLLA